MSTGDLLSSTLNWPGKGLYGLKSSVLQTTENNLVKQTIVSDHMRNHYRRLQSAKSAVDSKPPKAMVLGQKCRDRARKELAQLVYTQNLLSQFAGGSAQATPRGRSAQSARRTVQSQPTTFRARSRSIESSRMMTRSLNMNGLLQNLNQNSSSDGDIANKLLGGGVLSQALTAMTALGKMTSTARNKSSADVLDKHPDFFVQPEDEYKPRLVKRDGDSSLRNNRKYYNPPTKAKSRSKNTEKQETKTEDNIPNENKSKDDEQLALREQLNRSLELRHNVEKKIKKAKATTATNSVSRKQSDEALKQFGLSEQERLEYMKFMQEITDAIIRKNLTTEPAIEKLFELHIDRNGGNLDKRRLRGLLEALKEDLGVRTSRKTDTYASVHKATTFDREPLPPQKPAATREDSLILTPKTSGRRGSAYDLDAPLPWQSNHDDFDKQPTITPRKTHESKPKNFNDDHLFSPPSTAIKPKPRLSLHTQVEDHEQSNEIPHTTTTEHESTIPMNFNATVRKPITDLHNLNWLTDTPSAKTTTEKDSLDNGEEHHHHHEKLEAADEQRNPSPQQQHHRSAFETYGSNDFEDNDNDTDVSEQ
ncbi:unnamed protein product [Adineta steineri]|uniref:Uncharacterized protein n=1 Tax=Adineta steineri TaxID=433720 RepID=A0A818UKY7_9BILA|nr:unnamed protein product [Adineta steineri]CAF3693190.1 unnamed protein product [Adineta steineri]